jgi:hypothetical protein
MEARNSLFDKLTTIEALLLQSRLKSAYSHAGILFERDRSYDGSTIRRELVGLISDLTPIR